MHIGALTSALLAISVFSSHATSGFAAGELSAEASHSVVRESAIPVSFGGTASGLLQALDDVSDAALDAFVHKPLDNAGLPDYCDEACLEKSVWVRDGSNCRRAGHRLSAGCTPLSTCLLITPLLVCSLCLPTHFSREYTGVHPWLGATFAYRPCHVQYLAVLAGFNYTQRKQPNIDCGPVAWCSHITPVDTPDTHLLDLLQPAGRLAVIELAQVSSIVHDVIARKDAKCAPPGQLLQTSRLRPPAQPPAFCCCGSMTPATRRAVCCLGATSGAQAVGQPDTRSVDHRRAGSTGSQSRSCSRRYSWGRNCSETRTGRTLRS